MQTLFRLLHLPYLVQRIIIPMMDFTDLIELSMLSSIFLRILKQIRIPIDTLEWIFAMDFTGIRVAHGNQQTCIRVSMTPTLNQPCSINGSKMDISESKKLGSGRAMTIFDPRGARLEDIVKKSTAHLLSYLRIQNYELSISRPVCVTNLFVWNITKRFDKVWYLEDNVQNRWQIRVYASHLKFLFEKLETKLLFIDAVVYGEYYIRREVEHKHQEVRTGIFVPLCLRSLLNLDVEKISCYVRPSEENSVNMILKQWINGNHQKLGELNLRRSEHIRVLQGIKHLRSRFGRRELEVFGMYFGKARDIRRASDNQLATVTLTKDWVRMVVWNEKNLRKIGR